MRVFYDRSFFVRTLKGEVAEYTDVRICDVENRDSCKDYSTNREFVMLVLPDFTKPQIQHLNNYVLLVNSFEKYFNSYPLW